MTVVDLPRRGRKSLTHPADRTARTWRWTAGSGLALVLLATAHVIAQHFTVNEPGGLRTYHEVVEYVANPVMFVIESCFLFAVTIHGLLGVRSILLDFDLSVRTRHHLDIGLWVLGTVTVCYGLVLLSVLASRA